MKIFLSVPFSSRVNLQGDAEALYRRSIETLLAELRKHNHEVYCALEHAQWKMGGLTPPDEELRHDFAEIDATDKVVVLLEATISAGVQLENGYAFARGKTIEAYQLDKPAWSNIAFPD